MNAHEVLDRLKDGAIVPFPPAAWPAIEATFTEVERHATGFAGDLVLLRDAVGFLALEQPSAEEWVLRRLGEEAAARAFVAGRLEQYERQWDGCGCRIDYTR